MITFFQQKKLRRKNKFANVAFIIIFATTILTTKKTILMAFNFRLTTTKGLKTDVQQKLKMITEKESNKADKERAELRLRNTNILHYTLSKNHTHATIYHIHIQRQ